VECRIFGWCPRVKPKSACEFECCLEDGIPRRIGVMPFHDPVDFDQWHPAQAAGCQMFTENGMRKREESVPACSGSYLCQGPEPVTGDRRCSYVELVIVGLGVFED